MSTTPTTPQWAIEAAKEMFPFGRTSYIGADPEALRAHLDREWKWAASVMARHAPAFSPPTDEAKLREVIRAAVGAPCFEESLGCYLPYTLETLTDRILTALAPHLSQREPGDSELLDWLDSRHRVTLYRVPFGQHQGRCHFDVVDSNTIGNWRCFNADSLRAAIKSAMRGEGKP